MLKTITPVILILALIGGIYFWPSNAEVRGRLEDAITYGRISEVEELIPNVKNLNYVSFKGDTPLTNAIYQGDIEMVRVLVKAGADVNYSDGGDLRPLFYAISSNKFDISSFLVESGASLSERDQLSLSEMAGNTDPEIVELLKNAEMYWDQD